MIGRLEPGSLRCWSLQWSCRSYAVFPLPTTDGRDHRGKQTKAKEQEGKDHWTSCWDARHIPNGSATRDAHHGANWLFSSGKSLYKVRAGHWRQHTLTEPYTSFSAVHFGDEYRRTVLLPSGFCLDAVSGGIQHTIWHTITQSNIIVLHESIPVPKPPNRLPLLITQHSIWLWNAGVWPIATFQQLCPNN